MTDDFRYQRELCSFLSEFLTEHRRDLLPPLLLNRTRHITVVVEDIHKEHNASACLRSCDCFGVQDVHIIENRNEYQDNRQVSLGAEKWLTLKRYNEPGEDNTTRCLQSLREQGYQIVMTSPHQPTCDLLSYDVTRPTALIFGNEKDGVSETGRELSDEVMRIPMYGFSESFNISVAAAVALSHLVSQMRMRNVEWSLSEVERDELILAWVRAATGMRLASLEERFRNEIYDEANAADDTNLWPDWSKIEPAAQLERGSRHG